MVQYLSMLLQYKQNAKLRLQLFSKTNDVANLLQQTRDLSCQVLEVSHKNSELSQWITKLKLTAKKVIDKVKKS